METLTVGSKALYDSMSGLIPCKVTAITGKSGIASSEQQVTVVLTAKRYAYRRGETLTSWGLHIVPRKAVHVSGGQYRIHCYQVQVS